MKTLYININGEIIKSTEDTIVVGKPEDAIINKFYFELGKEILKGVIAPDISSIKKKDIVTDFRKHNEAAYAKIMEQWECVKAILLGDNPTGSRTITLPSEYATWLQNNSQQAYSEIAKSLYKRGCAIEISIDKIYKNAIGIIINNIEPNDCKQFVVNDNLVDDDSVIAVAIQEKIKGISFVPFEEYGKCPKCGKNPCECTNVVSVCPKCGKDPCECPQKNSPIFAVATYDVNYRKVKENFYFQLCDVHGHLVDNRSFLRIFRDDGFGKERSDNYDDYGNLIPDVNSFENRRQIKPLLGCCIEDGHLYYISKNKIVDICDYSHGRCDGDGNMYYEHNKDICDKYVKIKGSFVFIYEITKKKQTSTTIYEIVDNHALIRYNGHRNVDETQSWIVSQDKYNYVQDNDGIWPVKIGTDDLIKFSDCKEAYYLGTRPSGQDLFITLKTENQNNGTWSVVSLSGDFICPVRFDDIEDVSNNRRNVILGDKERKKFGISTIEGKMIVGKQYHSITEIQDGLFEMENYDYEMEYYSSKEDDYFQGLFNGYNWKNNKLFNPNNEIIFDDCISCRRIVKDLFHCCNSKREWWIVNNKGKLFQSNWMIASDCYKDNSYNKPCYRQNSDKIIAVIDDKPSIVSSDGSLIPIKYHPNIPFAYGKAPFVSENNSILYYDEAGKLNAVPWSNSKKITSVQMFSKNVLLVGLTNKNESAKYEILLTLEGKELLEQKHHGTFTNIIKLSENYFSVYNNGCCIMDMDGNVIIKPRYSKICMIY